MAFRPSLRFFRRGRVLVAALAVLAGLAISGALTAWLARAEHAGVQEQLAVDGQALVDSVAVALDRIDRRLQSLAAFYQADDDSVTSAEFHQFVETAGLPDGMVAVGYAYILNPGATPATSYRVDPDFGESRPVPGPGDISVPLLHFSRQADMSVALPIGLDLMSQPLWRDTVLSALASGSTMTTPFEVIPGTDHAGLLVIRPLADRAGSTTGVALAQVCLHRLLAGSIPESLQRNLQSWVAGAEAAPAAPAWEGRLAFGGREWVIGIAPREDSSLYREHFTNWVWLILGGSLSLLAGAGVIYLSRYLEVHRERDRLKAVSRAKDHFLASASHELRTPLTAVIGFLDEVINGDDLPPDEARELLEIAADQAQEMSYIVEQLITATRDDDRTLSVNLSVVDLHAEAVRATRAHGGNVHLPAGSEPQPMLVWADPARVRQIMRNLLANAAQHGAPPVEVTIETRGGHAQVRVADHGPGVAPEDVARLFDAYYTATRAPTQPDPLGLGLWVSRRLARLMGGDLVYYRDRTTVFELSLPTAFPEDAPPPARHQAREPIPAATGPHR